ncbi:MAG: orotate phosphoribosyltransferase [Cytophagales bacterium]|nr:MAG: orotate phosphoribosyltransferase [Cytophagales bacterium]
MSQIAKQVANMLLEVGAVKLSPNQPFTWASGWLSPIYCDNRVALSFPEVRTFIKKELASLVRLHFPEVEAIAGVATAGIPQGALVADLLELPFVYVRAKPKEHGMANLIEGKVSPNQKIVVIEDLISTGGSSLKAVKALQEAGVEVLGLLAIFSYGFEQAKQAFAENNVPFYSLSNYATLLVEAVYRDYVSEEDMASLQQWRLQPEKWGKEA